MAIRIDMLGWHSARDKSRATVWTYRMHGRLDLIGNDELDSRRLERILWIEPDHEMKDFVLEEYL